MTQRSPELKKIAEKLRISQISRHIFICTGDKCCSSAEGAAVWDWLKARCRESDAVEKGVCRTKVGCLRVCREGPVALVYPEGAWYANVDKDACSRIFEEHLLGGEVVSDLAFAVRRLPAAKT